MSDFFLKQNDTSPALRGTVKDGNGDPVDLTGATVHFHMRDTSGNVVIDAPATIITPAEGVLEYVWATGDTEAAGIFKAEFEVTFSDGSVATYPNTGYIDVKITDDVA